MIQAAENGLPLDMTNVGVSLSLSSLNVGVLKHLFYARFQLPVPPQLASKVSPNAKAGGSKLQPPAASARASLSPVKIEHKLIPGIDST